MYKINPSARASKISPLHISASLPLIQKFMPILALNLRSSGSNTKSKNYPDFWSPSNEEPLDENYHFMGEYSFLFALPSDRVRCAAGASSARPPHRRHESSMADIGALTPLENRPPFAEHSRITLQGTPYGGPALSHPDDRDIVPEGEASRRDTGRRGAHKIAQNVKFHDQPSARPPHRRSRHCPRMGSIPEGQESSMADIAALIKDLHLFPSPELSHISGVLPVYNLLTHSRSFQ